jgi:hypothetical protein
VATTVAATAALERGRAASVPRGGVDDATLAIRRTRVSAQMGGRRTVCDKAKPKTSTCAGIRVEVVSKRLGQHARISVTYDMYTHPDDEQQREAAQTSGGCWPTAWHGVHVRLLAWRQGRHGEVGSSDRTTTRPAVKLPIRSRGPAFAVPHERCAAGGRVFRKAPRPVPAGVTPAPHRPPTSCQDAGTAAWQSPFCSPAR